MNKKFQKIPFRIPGYVSHEHPTWEAWAPEEIDSYEWYRQFEQQVLDAIGKEFLPIVRLADGEFTFLIGKIDSNPRWPLYKRLRHQFSQFYKDKVLRRDFSFSTPNAYSSAVYTREEWAEYRSQYLEHLIWIGQKGILAPQLAFIGRPTIEQMQSGFLEWLDTTEHEVHLKNLVQFYFVYALLLTERRPKIINGQRVLVIHGADGERREKIVNSLKEQGAADVQWLPISSNRSIFDVVDVQPYVGKCDVCLIGAGVGKPFVIRQLEPLSVPVIDIGYVFEVWINEERRCMRPFGASDTFYDADKVRVHPTMRYIQDCR